MVDILYELIIKPKDRNKTSGSVTAAHYPLVLFLSTGNSTYLILPVDFYCFSKLSI